jgi:hypothetical protein
MYLTLTYDPHFRFKPRWHQTYRPLGKDFFKKLTESLGGKRKALEYLAMTPEQKTWFLLTNPAPHIPADFGPPNVRVRSGDMYEILVRKWANQKLAEMTRRKDYE